MQLTAIPTQLLSTLASLSSMSDISVIIRMDHVGAEDDDIELPDCFPPNAVAIPVQDLLVEDYLAPLLLDIVNCTDIRCDHVHTVDNTETGEGRDVVEFFFDDEFQGNQLVGLLTEAAPRCGDGFQDPNLMDWSMRTDAYDEELEITIVTVPRDAIPYLTLSVHKFLYPHGIKDIVDS